MWRKTQECRSFSLGCGGGGGGRGAGVGVDAAKGVDTAVDGAGVPF